jgi:hypothetical protein
LAFSAVGDFDVLRLYSSILFEADLKMILLPGESAVFETVFFAVDIVKLLIRQVSL